jgi:hypothetical protein
MTFFIHLLTWGIFFWIHFSFGLVSRVRNDYLLALLIHLFCGRKILQCERPRRKICDPITRKNFKHLDNLIHAPKNNIRTGSQPHPIQLHLTLSIHPTFLKINPTMNLTSLTSFSNTHAKNFKTTFRKCLITRFSMNQNLYRKLRNVLNISHFLLSTTNVEVTTLN